MSLSPEQLNSLDEWILDFLTAHEWAPPILLKEAYNDGRSDDDKTSRQWVSKRVNRLCEHDVLRRVHGTSTYALVEDPREENTPALETERGP